MLYYISKYHVKLRNINSLEFHGPQIISGQIASKFNWLKISRLVYILIAIDHIDVRY